LRKQLKIVGSTAGSLTAKASDSDHGQKTWVSISN
jgi:hypothetical protein